MQNIKSLASDGQYLYLYTSRGLFKIGSGYGGTIMGNIYLHKHDFLVDDKGWLGFAHVSTLQPQVFATLLNFSTIVQGAAIVLDL